MTAQLEQGDLALLDDPLAQDLLTGPEYARLAYTWPDGSARVVPVWFHWDGHQVVIGSAARAPKVAAIEANPEVALTIDTTRWPAQQLAIRGTAEVELRDDLTPEYEAATRRYLGDEAAEQWLSGLRGGPMARIAVTPRWAGLVDFETRFPDALSM